jgi:phenylpropionate dioxygenase-like ring-hydroxylating dioxygenase large terminal subunit
MSNLDEEVSLMAETEQSIENQYPRATAVIKQMQSSLKDGTIPIGIFNDQEIYEMEMERIFNKKWIMIGHDTEIPSPGDYVLRYIGEQPFIVIRNEEAKISVLLDACRHRGTRICRAEMGNTSHFRCPYHGWTYKNDGELIGMPAQQKAYAGFDKKNWGLVSIRVETLHGLIFVCLDEQTPSLEEYLGDQKFYLDLLFGLCEDDQWEVVGEPQRMVMDANWKLAVENFSGDDYHLMFLHRSTTEVDSFQQSMTDMLNGYHIQTSNGHCVSLSIDREGTDNPLKYWNFPKEMVDKFRLDQLSEKEHEIVRDSRDLFGNMYPSSSFLLYVVSPDGKDIPATPFLNLKQWMPKGPNKTEVWNWYLMFKGAPQEFKEQSYRAGCASFSMSGIFETDDVTVWESATQTAGSKFSQKALSLNYQMGLNGMGNAEIDESWPCPGVAYYPRIGEGNQRYFYETYIKDMLGGGN